jgi:hypothetical protein
MRLLVTSAAGANGDGYGALLAFDLEGRLLGAFSDDDRIADPRGLGVHPDQGLLFLNSGANRILAVDRDGKVVRDTGPIDGLNPGGGRAQWLAQGEDLARLAVKGALRETHLEARVRLDVLAANA